MMGRVSGFMFEVQCGCHVTSDYVQFRYELVLGFGFGFGTVVGNFVSRLSPHNVCIATRDIIGGGVVDLWTELYFVTATARGWSGGQ